MKHLPLQAPSLHFAVYEPEIAFRALATASLVVRYSQAP